jgi:hypothetical protein
LLYPTQQSKRGTRITNSWTAAGRYDLEDSFFSIARIALRDNGSRLSLSFLLTLFHQSRLHNHAMHPS